MSDALIRKILFPDRCPICDTASPIEGNVICKKCMERVKVYKNLKELPLDVYYDEGISLFAYGKMKESLYRFKYMDRPAYGREYARLSYEYIKDWIKAVAPDALVPVPIHKKRLIKRGYNQAKEIALELSRLSGIPVNDTLIKRRKNTIAQKYLRKRERSVNMKKAFFIRENVVNLRSVIIIDDIFTTGSTINAMAKECKNAGIEKVFFFTLCHAGE